NDVISDSNDSINSAIFAYGFIKLLYSCMVVG
ncbi:MAG: hypothetical protein ACI82S_003402, partial [Patiriisocius sp.]